MPNGVRVTVSPNFKDKLSKLNQNLKNITGKEMSNKELTEIIARHIKENPFDTIVDNKFRLNKKRGFPF